MCSLCVLSLLKSDAVGVFPTVFYLYSRTEVVDYWCTALLSLVRGTIVCSTTTYVLS